ncbi:hypothetical protein MNBD_ALPHA04-2415 [hydrothermal vent metagenome]|uniref:Uncharacterized protein n=1 Tax=hydrothermal vent metagenome TaxID=652676 RepID=A0A3B0SST5_9ZZZZ
MPSPSRLDDPLYASVAWSRYWRLIRWMGALSLVCVVIALSIMHYLHGFVSIHIYIATAGAVFFALMLMAVLMGLVFLSSESGHDESINDPLSKDVLSDE